MVNLGPALLGMFPDGAGGAEGEADCDQGRGQNMGIRLNIPTEPYWLDLAHGVRVHVRPLSTAIYESARRGSWRRCEEILKERADIVEVGGRVDGLPDLTDPDARDGFAQLLFAQALACAAIFEWRGVGDAEGNAAEVTPAAIGELMMIHAMAEDFVIKYTRTHEQVIAEGNAFGPSPSGTSAEGPNTAEDAASKDSPVPTESQD